MLTMDQDAFDIYKVPAYKRMGNIQARAQKPPARIEAFPATKNDGSTASYTKSSYVPQPVQPQPAPQVIDRRPRQQSYMPRGNGLSASNSNSGGFGQLYSSNRQNVVRQPNVRDMASRALENFSPGSVPRTLVQKVKERMAKDEEYSHSLWGDDNNDHDDYEEERAPVYQSNFPKRRMQCVGIITHYFEKIDVCVVDLIDGVQVGENLVYEEEGHFLSEQMLESMQVNKNNVARANKGQQVGVKIDFLPKIGGKVWRVMI